MGHLKKSRGVYMEQFALEMDDFVPIPYLEYTSLNYFLQKNLGLLAIVPKPMKEQSTQTEPPTKEQSTQTRKPGVLWSYFG